MNFSKWIVAGVVVAIAGGGMPAHATTLLSNAVAIGAISATATSNFGAPYTTDRTIDHSDISGTYISGVTSTTVVDGFTNLVQGNGWHGGYAESVGNIVFDLGSNYTLDRVYLFWMNDGDTNNIANLTVDVSANASFASFTSPAAFGVPTGGVNRVDFTALGTGRYVRLSWTALQGQYPGLNEFIAGGVASAVGGVPEPANWAMLIAGFGLTGAAMRRRRASFAPAV